MTDVELTAPKYAESPTPKSGKIILWNNIDERVDHRNKASYKASDDALNEALYEAINNAISNKEKIPVELI